MKVPMFLYSRRQCQHTSYTKALLVDEAIALLLDTTQRSTSTTLTQRFGRVRSALFGQTMSFCLEHL